MVNSHKNSKLTTRDGEEMVLRLGQNMLLPWSLMMA